MKRKHESNLTELTDKPVKMKIDHQDLVNMMRKNDTDGIIRFIKNSLEESRELRKNITLAQYLHSPVLNYMNIYNYAIFNSSKELYEVLDNNKLIPDSWYEECGLAGHFHPLTLAIIINNRIFLSYFLAKNPITSENQSKSLMEAINFSKKTQDVFNVCNTKMDFNDTIKWILNLSCLPENFKDFYIKNTARCWETQEILKKNFEEVSNFRNNLFTMFKASRYDEGSSPSALNKDSILAIHKIGFN